MKLKIILILLVFVSKSYSQKGIVYYGQIKSPGMRSAAGPDLNSYLIFNKHQAYYVTAKDSLEKDSYNNRSLYKGDGEKVAAYNGNKTYRYGEQVLYNREKDSLWWSQRFGGNIYIAEKKPAIDWKLLPETKKIGKFSVNKASCEFRGRTYTVWYTLEVPLPYGPWKLQGLPGLILEARDERDEMVIYFKSLEYPTTNKTTISEVKRLETDSKDWQTIEDFENMLRNSITKAYNGMILRAEKNGSKKPEKPKFSDIYIESF
ncbi:GLPGLI family protein [Formosa sp. A9]|uniref:GLPGLI family protein n=1 Tax=Formosa sp. A9 TaxID=3442641 RepID=UPI003EC02C7F